MVIRKAKSCVNFMYSILFLLFMREIINYISNGVLSYIMLLAIFTLLMMSTFLSRLLTRTGDLINQLIADQRVISEQIINIRHDVRSPVSGILYLAMSIQSKSDDGEIKRLMTLIIKSTKELMTRIELSENLLGKKCP